MQEEFTAEMFKDFKTSEVNEKISKAACVWCDGVYTTEEEQRKAAELYGLTWEEALKYRYAAENGLREYSTE